MEKTLICQIKECIEGKLDRGGVFRFYYFPIRGCGDAGETGIE